MWAGRASAWARRLAGCGAVGSTLGLVYSGFSWPLALLVTVIVSIGLLVAAAAAWLQPERVVGAEAWKALAKVSVGAFGGAVAGFLVGRALRHGSDRLDDLGPVMLDVARSALPSLLVVIVGTVLRWWCGPRSPAPRLASRLPAPEVNPRTRP